MINKTLPLTRFFLILLFIYQTQAISLEIYRKDKEAGDFSISYHLGYIEGEACKHCQKNGAEKKLGLIEVRDNNSNELFPSKEMGAKNTFSEITYLCPDSKYAIESIDGFKGFDPNSSSNIRDIMCTSCFKNNDKIPKSNFIKEVAKHRDIIAELNQTVNGASQKTLKKKEHNPFIKNENNIISINEKKYWYSSLSVLQAILQKDESLQPKIQSTSCECQKLSTHCIGDDPDQLIMLLKMNGRDFDVVESRCKTCIELPEYHRSFSMLSAILSDQDHSDLYKITTLHKIKGNEDLISSKYFDEILPRLAHAILTYQTKDPYSEDFDNAISALLLTSTDMATHGVLTTESISGIPYKIYWDNSDDNHALYVMTKDETEKRKYDFMISKNSWTRNIHIDKENNSYQQLPKSTCKNIPLLKQAKIDELDALIEKEREKFNEHFSGRSMSGGSSPKKPRLDEPD